MTIMYDAADINELNVIFHWKGTVLPMVLCRPVFWMLNATHMVLFYLHFYRTDIHMPPMAWKTCTIPIFLLTIFLVFFAKSCLSRYFALYKKCMAMALAVDNYTSLLRDYFPVAKEEELFSLARYPIASLYLTYFQLSGVNSDGGASITESEATQLTNNGLLTPAEMKQVQAYKGFRPFLMQMWALKSIAHRLHNDPAKRPGISLKSFETQILKLREQSHDIVDWVNAPVPFPYFHTVNLMLVLNLLLCAYALIDFETVVTFPCFFVISLVALGLKETSSALSDPFGTDEVDFDTDEYMKSVLKSARSIISLPGAPPPDRLAPLFRDTQSRRGSPERELSVWRDENPYDAAS